MNYWFGDSAHIIHVAKTGNDANAGHAQQYPVAFAADAKLTIASALGVAVDGDTIVVWPGTYDEQVDIETAAISISLVGTHRHKCKITQATTNKTVLTYDNCVLQNLTIEQTGTAIVVDSEGRDNCRFIDCDIIGENSPDGLYCIGGDNIRVKNCYILSNYDSLYIGTRFLVEDCIIITTALGTTGATEKHAFISSSTGRGIVRNTILIASPPWGKAVGKSAELYESVHDFMCLSSGDQIVLENCVLVADGYFPGGAHADSYANGDAYCVSNISNMIIINCTFLSRTDQNEAGTTAYGIYNSNAGIINGVFEVVGQANSYVFDAATAKILNLMNTVYDSAQIGSNVTVKTSSIDDKLTSLER